MTLFDRDIQFVDHIGKEREINDTPNDKIDPDFVRIVKLEKIVEEWYNEIKNHKTALMITHRRISDYGNYIKRMFSDINALSHTEHYTTEEVKDALLGHFIHDDIIIFLLKPYMENLWLS